MRGQFKWVLLFLCMGIVRLSSVETPRNGNLLTKEEIAQQLGEKIIRQKFPTELSFKFKDEELDGRVEYTIDSDLQATMEKLIRSYQPDYAAFVACDAETGELLSLISFSKANDSDNLAVRASIPAASIFKIVTATTGIDQKLLSADSVIPFNGGYHTLYRRNVAHTNQNRWTRHMTIREAFAKSVNSVFGKIGYALISPFQMEHYARRFQFNESISSDIPIEKGMLLLNSDDPWAMAEVASGFTRVAQMSPVQGALMAAAVANDGKMMEPYVVRTISSQGERIYQGEPKVLSLTMNADTAAEMRSMMQETVKTGTARSVFRPLFRKRTWKEVAIGGKTGSLTGGEPFGKCDWFVGYGKSETRKVAVSALTINKKNWRVKSSYLAKTFFEKFFDRVE